MSDVRLRYEVLRAAGDALAAAVEDRITWDPRLRKLVDAYRAARDAAPADEPHAYGLLDMDRDGAVEAAVRLTVPPEPGQELQEIVALGVGGAIGYLESLAYPVVLGPAREAARAVAPAAVPSGLPVVLASVDDVAATETRTEYRVLALHVASGEVIPLTDQPESHDKALARAKACRDAGFALVRVESRSVSTTTRTTDWKADER